MTNWCALEEAGLMAENLIRFPTYNVGMGDACVIVRERLDDETLAMQSKVLAIEKIARMETHNSVRKDDLVHALRWIFDHYDLLSVL